MCNARIAPRAKVCPPIFVTLLNWASVKKLPKVTQEDSHDEQDSKLYLITRVFKIPTFQSLNTIIKYIAKYAITCRNKMRNVFEIRILNTCISNTAHTCFAV